MNFRPVLLAALFLLAVSAEARFTNPHFEGEMFGTSKFLSLVRGGVLFSMSDDYDTGSIKFVSSAFMVGDVTFKKVGKEDLCHEQDKRFYEVSVLTHHDHYSRNFTNYKELIAAEQKKKQTDDYRFRVVTEDQAREIKQAVESGKVNLLLHRTFAHKKGQACMITGAEILEIKGKLYGSETR